MDRNDLIIASDDPILITGANGFIGARVVSTLIGYGFSNLLCFVRPSGNLDRLNRSIGESGNKSVKIIHGNLLSKADCERAAAKARIVIHLAAGIGKSYPTCVLNSVVTTRNLADAVLKTNRIERFLNVSSFAVYSGSKLKSGDILDETCGLETPPQRRGEAYCYGKAKQDELVQEYGRRYGLPYVIVRPGAVYGPGKNAVTGRVGIDTFGIYLHMGGTNRIPFTYVDNCAEAMVKAALIKGCEREVFNIVDDDLPRSCDFLAAYKQNVKSFKSINIPKKVSYLMCFLWEKYSRWSGGQVPPVFNRSRWAAEWKGHRYSNMKLKQQTGWKPVVSTEEAMQRYFVFCRAAGGMEK